MTPRLPVLSAFEVLRALAERGFTPVGRGGGHIRLKREDGRIVVVPDHPEIAVGTLLSILRQARRTAR